MEDNLRPSNHQILVAPARPRRRRLVLHASVSWTSASICRPSSPGRAVRRARAGRSLTRPAPSRRRQRSTRDSTLHHSSPVHRSPTEPTGSTQPSVPPGSPRSLNGVVVSGVCRTNDVTLRRARLVVGWVTVFEAGILSVHAL